MSKNDSLIRPRVYSIGFPGFEAQIRQFGMAVFYPVLTENGSSDIMERLVAENEHLENDVFRNPCFQVGSGQWAVGSGQWAVGSGQWAVGSGQWAVNRIDNAIVLQYRR